VKGAVFFYLYCKGYVVGSFFFHPPAKKVGGGGGGNPHGGGSKRGGCKYIYLLPLTGKNR